MERFFHLLGKLFFPRLQDWEQGRNAKILLAVLGFSVLIALVTAKIIRVYYNHER
jgi:hypothetical protein